ncbi:MAG: DUF188 domain-containing protein [Proteobacteria bacterium]|nr:DUF188 domain-containing protein [Pseudomonadota bacterium]
MFAVSRCRPTREANPNSVIYGSLPRIRRYCLRGVASRACRKRTPGTWIIGRHERNWQNHEDEGFDLLHITEDNIGMAVASRNLMSELRSAGEITGGPSPLSKRDRSHFLQKLDSVIQSIRREH